MPTNPVKLLLWSASKLNIASVALRYMDTVKGKKWPLPDLIRYHDSCELKGRAMRFGQVAIAILAILTIASCKITVVVPEGGSVTTSSGTFSCAAGDTCNIDVVDFYFDETFLIAAADGYAFKSWRKGDRRFCGNSPRPCHLFTTLFSDDWIPVILKFLESEEEVFYLQPVFAPLGDTVSVNGKEWLQPDLFSGLTWDQINAACPEGLCAGVLKGQNLDGWIWASVDDVNELFNYYIGKRKLGPGGGHYEEIDSVWAPAFFNTGWRRSGFNVEDDTESTYGWTRTIQSTDEYGTFAYAPGITNCLTTCPSSGYPLGTDTARTISDLNTMSKSSGAWFFRKP